MKQKFAFLFASMLISLTAMAQWTKPVPATVDTYQYSTLAAEGGDTVVYYLYNKDAGAFYTQGNSWDTQASIGATGLKVLVSKYAEEGADWDGKTVIITDYAHHYNSTDYSWMLMYIEDDKAWADRDVDAEGKADYKWEIEANGTGVYRIKPADINPAYNSAVYGNGNSVYLGVSIENDPNTTALSPLIDIVEDVTAQINWQFVTEEAYATYLDKQEAYAAAEVLGAVIIEAEGYGLNTESAKAVYANTSATVEELQAAAQALRDAINEYKENAATPDHPQDLTETYIPDADFELNQGAGVWKRSYSDGNFQTNGTPGKNGDDTYFLESWSGSVFTGKVYLAIENLPNGVYEFHLSAYTSGGYGSYVYAGNDSVEVVTANMTPYTVITRVEDGTLEVGMKMPQKIQNWIGIDDAKLFYVGNSVPSYAYWMNQTIDNAPKYSSDDFVQKAALEAYKAVIDTDLSQFTTVESILEFNNTLNKAIAVIAENAAAYARYKGLLDLIEVLQVSGYEGDAADEIYDYLMGEGEEIVNSKALSTEEMNAECDMLEAKIEVVKKTCMQEGTICSILLVNPDFKNHLDGWTRGDNVAWGGLADNPTVECYSGNFDFYQTVTDVPNGVYELRVPSFYRPVSSTKDAYDRYVEDPEQDEILAYLYINGNQVPVTNIAAHTYPAKLEGDCSEVATGLWIPNSMTAASVAFEYGDYMNSVRGIVTDGKLTVGVKSPNGSTSGRWTIWGGFTLAFAGLDKDLIDEMIASYTDEIEELMNEVMGNDAREALDKAYNAGEEAADGEEAFAALQAIITAIADAKESVAAYAKVAEANDKLVEAMESADPSSPIINKAQTLYEEVSTAYEDGSYTTAEALAKVDEINTVIAEFNLPSYEGASDVTPVDFTTMIVNPSYDEENSDGWEGSVPSHSGYNRKDMVEYWQASFNHYQTIYGLPAGTYELKLNCYARVPAGQPQENLDSLEAGAKEKVMSSFVYVETGDKTFAEPFRMIAEGARTKTFGDGAWSTIKSGAGTTLYTPDNMKAAGDCFEETDVDGGPLSDEQNYVVRVVFTLDETSKVKIGAKNSTSGSWSIWDNWKLTYFGTSSSKSVSGDATGIEAVEGNSEAPAIVGIYTISGTRVATLQKGINIVKGADGSVKKVLVK